MIQAILNGLQTVVLKPQSNLFAILSVVLQGILLFFSFDFLTNFLQNVVSGVGFPQATGLGFLIGFIQTYPVELAGTLLLVMAFAGIQMGMMITQAHYAGQLQKDSTAHALQSMRFGFGQFTNIVFALLFLLMVGVLGMALLGIIMELSGIHYWLGIIFLAGFMLFILYLLIKFFFAFTIWGVWEGNLKEGLGGSFAFVSNHWIQTIGFVIFFSIVNSIISMLVFTVIQSWDDTGIVGVAVLVNIVLSTFYGLTLGFYVCDQMGEKKAGSEKSTLEKPLRRNRKK